MPAIFIGQYYHHLEEKGRLSIPKKYRPNLANGAILSQGLDGCLFLYTKEVWDQLLSRLSSLPLTRSDARSFLRRFTFAAVEVDIDRLGRILVPEYLRQYADITGDCVLAGAVDRIEIWSKTRFDSYTALVNSQAEDIAEKLSDAGI